MRRTIFTTTKLLIAFIFIVLPLLYPKLVSAYTGSFSIFPPASGGPEHTNVTKFGVNTNLSNPQTISIDLFYVEKITIETDGGQTGPLLIKEHKTGSNIAFSITIPKKIQDSLITATVYFWGPDVDTLQIWHQHKNEDPVLINAIKVEPETTNEDGSVLWSFTTTSFSSFYVDKIQTSSILDKDIPWIPLIILVTLAISA
ncbi:MAG TPA: hypothetical protein ENI23_11650, partial [bacterium]|nr:hypothetical protein [bacterium]